MPVFHPSTPCIVTNHHFEGNTSLEPYHTADAVMTVSRQWHEEILARGVPSEKCVMVPNGVDVELFKPPSREQKAKIRKKLGFERDRIYIGFSGKRSSDTSKRKGLETLTKAIQSLSRTKEIGLAIIGPGWDDLVREQRQRGIACVYSPFLVDRGDVADFYKAINIYWVTSKIEGGPVPLLEAMSSEVACVSDSGRGGARGHRTRASMASPLRSTSRNSSPGPRRICSTIRTRWRGWAVRARDDRRAISSLADHAFCGKAV